MTGRARRTRSGSRSARARGPSGARGPKLAALAAALIVVVAVSSLYFTQATADAAEAHAAADSGSEAAPSPTALPAPSPGGAGPLQVPDDALPPVADALAVVAPANTLQAGLAGLPHEVFHGRVLDPDGQPIAGAVVAFVPGHAAFHALGRNIWYEHQLEPDELPRTTTNARGEFAVDGPHVTHCIDGVQLGDSWASEPGVVAWAPGFTANPHVCIGYRGGPCDVGDLSLEKEARLHGRVVDAQGKPLEGVVLRYIVEDLSPARLPAGSVHSDDDMLQIFQRARTAADGQFALGGLWQGEGQLHLQLEGLVTTDVDELRPTSGQDLDVGTLTMASGGSLAGSVLDADGHPVPGAEVVLTGSLDYDPRGPEARLLVEEQAFGDAFARHLAVDDAGRFRVLGLDPDGAFALFARSPTHDVALLDELRPDGSEQALVLNPAATLRIAVVDAVSGAALPEAVVVARRVASRGDDEQLIPLAVGPAPEGAPATWYVPRAGRLCTLLIVSAAGHATRTQRVDGLEAGARRDETVSLPPQLGLTGRVEDRKGAPIAAATVKASLEELAQQSQFTDSWPTAKTDAEGRYELAGIGPGTWQVEAQAEGFVPAEPVSVEVADVPPTQGFVLAKAASIRGRALRQDGRPAAGATIVLQSWDEAQKDVGDVEADVPIDPSGRFVFDGLKAGSYRLHWAGSRIVAVAEGEVQELELREPKHPVIHASVVQHGARCPGAYVRALHWTDTLGVSGGGYVGSKPEGTGFRLELPEAGTYVLAAWLRQGASVSGKTTVTLDWGEEAAIELPLGTQQITGRVVDKTTGAGLESSWITLSDVDDQQLQVNARTVADGGFRFEGVMPGRYQVNAGGKDHLYHRFDPVTVPAEPELVELPPFALEQAARLRLTLHSALGSAGPEMAAVYVVNEAKDEVEDMEMKGVNSSATFVLTPGRHWLVAVPSGGELDDDAWRHAPGMQSVELVAGQVTEAVLVVQ